MGLATNDYDPPYISRQVSESRRFYLGAAGGEVPSELAVMGGGWERTTADYLIRRERFPWLALEFVAEGAGTLEVAGRRHELGPGSVYTYGPEVPHVMKTDRGRLLSKYYLNFVGRQAEDLLTAANLAPGSFRIAPNSDELRRAFDQLIDEGRNPRPQTATIVGLHLHILLLKLGGDRLAETVTDRRAQQSLRNCLAHIDRHFRTLATAEEVALACHVSPSHMARLFRRYGYGSPYGYLVRRKMVYAAELFDSGYLLVREVAEKLGLDPFQFSRMFKRVHALSPSEFIRRHGG